MGPTKKNKIKEKPKENYDKCVFYNTGYCKQGVDCSKIHPETNCEDEDCLDEGCDKRHPNPCKFGRRCRYKRRNICFYLHAITDPNPENCKAFENKFDKKFTLVEKHNENMKNSIEKLIDEKFTLYEENISNLRKDLEIKNTQINALEMRMEELEKEHHAHKKQQDKKIKDLENSCKQKL